LALVSPDLTDLAAKLARTIAELRPDIVHCLEMQHAGYLLLATREKMPRLKLPPVIYSSWGSDLFFFGRQADHTERIRAFLAMCDYFIADCQRDVQLASDFGFKGEVLGVFPGGGGYDLERARQLRQPAPVLARRVVAVKGYHDDCWAGRALVALRAIELCADVLGDYEVVIYSASANVRAAAEQLSAKRTVRISVLPPSQHEEILRLMGHARVAIGVSVSDGTPNSLLEAMLMGAFPIQSDTGATAEWVTHCANGFLVPPEDAAAVATAIRTAIDDDALVEKAAVLNERIVVERINQAAIQPQVVALYERVAVKRSPAETVREVVS
jgi:glycosyltransferase involved in cell wall biosynthesis